MDWLAPAFIILFNIVVAVVGFFFGKRAQRRSNKAAWVDKYQKLEQFEADQLVTEKRLRELQGDERTQFGRADWNEKLRILNRKNFK